MTLPHLDTILPHIKDYHTKNKRIVLVTGVFDLLHSEHKKFLSKAKQAGDILIVGIESDARVEKIKGSERPVNQAKKRLKNLTDLNLIDEIFVLPEVFSKPSDHEALIGTIKPKVLAVSSHTKHLEAKQKILSKHGGQVQIVHQHNPKISTTILLEKQKKKVS